MRKKSPRSKWQQPAERRCKVPNWEKAHLYPKDDELSIDEWRWEFLRRDPEYMKDWQHYRAINHPFQLSLKGTPESDSYDLPYYPEEYEDRWDDIWRIFRKYGLSRLLDPDVSRPKYVQFHFVPFRPDIHDLPELRGTGIKRLPWQLCNPYLGWFDLWHPIEPQVALITELLKREQLLALQAVRKEIPEEMRGKNKTLDTWEPPELEAVRNPEGSNQEENGQGKSSRSPYPIRNIPFDSTGFQTLLRVWDARCAGEEFKDIGVKVLDQRMDDYATASTQAHDKYEAAIGMWRKIRTERIPGPALGLEDLQFHHSVNVIPPYTEGSSRLDNWLNCLHPRLHTLLLPSLR